MQGNMHQIRKSTFEEVISRNIQKPNVIERIKHNILEILAILMNGFGKLNIKKYCMLTDKPDISDSVFYDYLYMIEMKLRNFAELICDIELIESKKNEIVKYGFDATWGHRRNSSNCLGILMNLYNNKIVAFDIVHHGEEMAKTLTPTLKNSKCMEKIALDTIIFNSNLKEIQKLVFVHDCDLTDEKAIRKELPNATIYFDTNHLCKKNKKIINNFCSSIEDLKELTESIENFYSILIHDIEISKDDKKSKLRDMPHYFIEKDYISENSDSVIKLNELIQQLSLSFDEVDSNLSTNPIESFNYTRSLLASKTIAYRSSWRIRSYISIIKWNCHHWMSDILKQFDIEVSEKLIEYENSVYERKIQNHIEQSKTINKKKRAIQRKRSANKYKINPDEICIHNFADDHHDETQNKKRIESFPKIQKGILYAISTHSTEDNPYVTKHRIFCHFDDFAPVHPIPTRSSISSQITKLCNRGIISRKKRSYKLEVDLDI